VGPTRHGAIELTSLRTIGRSPVELHRPPVAPTRTPSVAELTTHALVSLHIEAAVTVDRNHRAVYY
jgi:hypothetical protein